MEIFRKADGPQLTLRLLWIKIQSQQILWNRGSMSLISQPCSWCVSLETASSTTSTRARTWTKAWRSRCRPVQGRSSTPARPGDGGATARPHSLMRRLAGRRRRLGLKPSTLRRSSWRSWAPRRSSSTASASPRGGGAWRNVAGTTAPPPSPRRGGDTGKNPEAPPLPPCLQVHLCVCRWWCVCKGSSEPAGGSKRFFFFFSGSCGLPQVF